MIKQYTTILLDMYGVILEQSKGCLLKYAKDNFDDEKYNEVERLVHRERLFDKAGLGEIGCDEFMRLLGFDDPKHHSERYIKNYLTLDKGFISFAEAASKSYRLVLLSNDIAEWSDFAVKHFGIEKYFCHRTVSAAVKCKKPDFEIYERTLEAIGATGAECIFVDNNVDNLHTAEELGISPVLFNRDGVHFDGATVESFLELGDLLGVKK